MNILSAIQNVAKAPQLAKVVNPIVKIAHRHGPEILTGVGIAGSIATAVLASKATLQVEPILDEIKHKTNDINELKENSDRTVVGTPEEYTDKKVLHDKAGVYIRGSFKLLKLYTPTITMGTASIVAILAAHGIMRRRQASLLAAYKVLETGFERYRKRVIEKYGEDIDRDFRLGFVDEVKTDKKTGEKTTVTRVDQNQASPYVKFFDEYNPNWKGNNEYNLMFLRGIEDYWNNILMIRGHVFLNEVYDNLGIDHTGMGARVGWVWNNPEGTGDNKISFGIYNTENENNRIFVNNGNTAVVVLDFNVDGLIDHLI